MASKHFFIFIIIFILFVILTPGVLLRIPNKGSLLKQTTVYGIIFIICVYLIHLFYMRIEEGFANKKSLCPTCPTCPTCPNPSIPTTPIPQWQTLVDNAYFQYKLNELLKPNDKYKNFLNILNTGKLNDITNYVNTTILPLDLNMTEDQKNNIKKHIDNDLLLFSKKKNHIIDSYVKLFKIDTSKLQFIYDQLKPTLAIKNNQ